MTKIKSTIIVSDEDDTHDEAKEADDAMTRIAIRMIMLNLVMHAMLNMRMNDDVDHEELVEDGIETTRVWKTMMTMMARIEKGRSARSRVKVSARARERKRKSRATVMLRL